MARITEEQTGIADHHVLLDAFAGVRGTWDDLITLQPDVMAGSGSLKDHDLVELGRRVAAHRAAVDLLADTLETAPSQRPPTRSASAEDGRITNRQAAEEKELQHR